MAEWVLRNWQWVVAVIAVPFVIALLNHFLSKRRETRKIPESKPKLGQTIKAGDKSQNYQAGGNIQVDRDK
jgi:hypothetical protein